MKVKYKVAVAIGIGVALMLGGCLSDEPDTTHMSEAMKNNPNRKHASEAPPYALLMGNYQDEYANFTRKWREVPEVTELLEQSDKDLIKLLYSGKQKGLSNVNAWNKRLLDNGLKDLHDFNGRHMGSFYYTQANYKATEVFRVMSTYKLDPTCPVSWAFLFNDYNYPFVDNIRGRGYRSERTQGYWTHRRGYTPLNGLKPEDAITSFSAVELPLKPYSDTDVYDTRQVTYIIPIGGFSNKLWSQNMRKVMSKEVRLVLNLRYAKMGDEWFFYSVNTSVADGISNYKPKDCALSPELETNSDRVKSYDTGIYSGTRVAMRDYQQFSIGGRDPWGEYLRTGDEDFDPKDMKMLSKALFVQSWWTNIHWDKEKGTMKNPSESFPEKVNNFDWGKLKKKHFPIIRFWSRNGSLGRIPPAYYRPGSKYSAKNYFYSGEVKHPSKK